MILDEPTAPLSNSETEELFRIVRELKKDDVGIIFISHRLNELFEICETITVMRDGKVKNISLNVKKGEIIGIAARVGTA